MVQHVPYDGYGNVRYDELGPAANSVPEFSISEVFGTMDQKLAEERNSRNSTVKSRIRVQLSRKLTWAEKEDIETDQTDRHNRKLDGSGFDGLKLWVSPKREHVWAEASYGSRPLYEMVAKFLSEFYVNVFPRAVRTFREYNGE